MKSLFTLGLALSLAFNIMLFLFISKELKKYQHINPEDVSEEKQSCEETCKENNIDLHINDLDKAVKNNKKAIEIIKDECLWVQMVDKFDVTGDGKQELILNSGGAGCGSCHYRTVHILEGENVIFRIEGDDFSIEKPSLSVTGFKLLKPLRRIDEGLCCPTEYVAETYEYNPPERKEDIGEIYRDIVATFTIKKTGSSFDYPFIFYDSRVEMRKEQVVSK